MSKSTMERRTFLRNGLGAAAALAALPAAGSLTSAPAYAAGPAKPSQLRLLYATVEADAAAIQLVAADFQRQVGVPLQVDTMPYNSLQQKVFAELAASSSYYDIVIVDTPWMPALTRKIQPLTDYMTNKKMSSSQLNIGDFISKVFYDTAVYHPTKSYLHFPHPTNGIDPAAIKASLFAVLMRRPSLRPIRFTRHVLDAALGRCVQP